MKNCEIIDNALSPEHFHLLKDYMTNQCDWYFQENITADLEEKVFPFSYFFHTFFEYNSDYNIHVSRDYQILLPILNVLKPKALSRVKGNLYVNQNQFVNHGKHYDSPHDLFVAVYYVNSNNGYTALEDGTKIESVENRLAIFKSNILHNSTNCTDEWKRITINFNYF